MSEWKYVKRDGWPITSGRYDLAWQDGLGELRTTDDVWMDEEGQTAEGWPDYYAWREHSLEEAPPLEPDGEES